MAMEWVPNELALKYQGVSIYHVYKDDDNCQGVRSYCFGLDQYGSDNGTDECSEHIVFDVRDLPSYDSSRDAEDNLRKAIDDGEITQKYVKTKEQGMKYDVVLCQCIGDRGLDKTVIEGMMIMLNSYEFYPVEFYADHAESYATGFIAKEAAKALKFDYDELKACIGAVLDNFDQEHNYYGKINGLEVFIARW